jgi:hypothetical protein
MAQREHMIDVGSVVRQCDLLARGRPWLPKLERGTEATPPRFDHRPRLARARRERLRVADHGFAVQDRQHAQPAALGS